MAKGLFACVVRRHRVNSMSDEEMRSDEAENSEPEVSEASKNTSDEEAMKNRFKLIAGEEVLLTKSPSPVGFMSMYMLGLIVFGIHMLFWRPDSLLNEDSGGLARFLVWVMGCLLYTSPSPRDLSTSRMPSSA